MPIRPDLQQRYDAAMKEHQTALAAVKDPQQLAAAVATAQRAADVFAGSSDAQELELRHTALLYAAGALRSAGRLPEAEAAFDQAGKIACAEAGFTTREYPLARYYVGLVRQQQGNDAGAAEAFREAFDVFVMLPDSKNEARLVGAALGLSLLRERRWNDVVAVLQRIANPSIVDESEASIHHNLALALVRGGRPEEAAPTAHTASMLRERISGAAHPLTIETWLVEALALADSGQSDAAGALIRKAAAVILGGPGEGHPFFARALLAEARRIVHLGDGAAAEALARRAAFILDSANISPDARGDYDAEARELPSLWRPSTRTNNASEVRLWRVYFQHTLRRYQVASLDFAGSGDMGKFWYVFVPASVRMDDPAVALRQFRVVLADASARLNAREPADANFIDVTNVSPMLMTVSEIAGARLADFFPQRTWEDAAAYSLVTGSRSQPIDPPDFAEAVIAYATLNGGKIDLQPWVALGLDAAPLQKAAAAPADTLRRILNLP